MCFSIFGAFLKFRHFARWRWLKQVECPPVELKDLPPICPRWPDVDYLPESGHPWIARRKMCWIHVQIYLFTRFQWCISYIYILVLYSVYIYIIIVLIARCIMLFCIDTRCINYVYINTIVSFMVTWHLYRSPMNLHRRQWVCSVFGLPESRFQQLSQLEGHTTLAARSHRNTLSIAAKCSLWDTQ